MEYYWAFLKSISIKSLIICLLSFVDILNLKKIIPTRIVDYFNGMIYVRTIWWRNYVK